jgi:hypothetical protein
VQKVATFYTIVDKMSFIIEDKALIIIIIINIQASHAWLKKSNIRPETEGFIFAIQDRVINRRNYKKHICGLQSIIDKCRICGTEGETIEHIISSSTVLAQSEYKKRHDIFAKIIHMNLADKFNLLKDTQPHYTGCPKIRGTT